MLKGIAGVFTASKSKFVWFRSLLVGVSMKDLDSTLLMELLLAKLLAGVADRDLDRVSRAPADVILNPFAGAVFGGETKAFFVTGVLFVVESGLLFGGEADFLAGLTILLCGVFNIFDGDGVFATTDVLFAIDGCVFV